MPASSSGGLSDSEDCYEFCVATSNHDLLRQGITVAGMVRVQVSARNPVEARLIALQMASCCPPCMPTDIWEDDG